MLNRTATQLYLSLHWFVCILTPLKHMNTGNLALTLFERGWLQKKFVTACPKFCRDSRKWISTRISLPAAKRGEIPGKIAPRFWPTGMCFSLRFAIGSWRDVQLAAGIFVPGENLNEIHSWIPARFWPPGISLAGDNLAGILPGIKISVDKIPPESRRDPAKIPVHILQLWGTENTLHYSDFVRLMHS